jgi:glycosyltransferase involved in cell wall biosynthesis
VGDPRVTVGFAVFNGERFIAEAIESILQQDHGELEVLVADNASTDGTREICEAFAARDPRVRVLPSDVNRGLAWNHNRAVKAATGEYFKWAAYDDVYRPSYVSQCVGALTADPGAVLAYTGTVDIDPDGVELTRWPVTNRASATAAAERFRDVLLNERQCFPIYGVVRTEVLRRTPLMGAFPSSDQPLLAELALHGRFIEIPEPLFLHREHPARSMTAFPRLRDRLAFYDPNRAGHLTLPRWRIAAAFVAAIGRAPISPAERAKALAGLPPWLARWRMELAGDLYGVARELGRRVSRRG